MNRIISVITLVFVKLLWMNVVYTFKFYSFTLNHNKIFFHCTKFHRMLSSDQGNLINDELNNLDLIHNINTVKENIYQSALSVGRNPDLIRLVAVSKTKPIENILTLYNNGQFHFGENYFQELVDKAENLPNDIKWHFIGHLQSSKASKLIRSVPNLYVVETIDSIKLAKKLQSACENVNRETLNVFIQVDTSLEDTKSGVLAEEVIPLTQLIITECPSLKVKGLMTIGAPGDLTCFDKLIQCRDALAIHLGIEPTELEVSMGMSGDYEEAIKRGATSVRVGSTIFGARIYKKNNN